MPYSGSPSYPSNAPAGAPTGTSYASYTVGSPPGYAPTPSSTWASIMSAIASMFGGGGSAATSGGSPSSTGAAAAPAAPTQPPPSSFAGAMQSIAEDRATRSAEVNKQPTTAPAAPLTVPSISEDRATRSAAVDAPASSRISGSPAFDATGAPVDPFAATEAIHSATETAKPFTGTTGTPAKVTYSIAESGPPPKGGTSMTGEQPRVTDALAAIQAAAPSLGLERIDVTGGAGKEGHVSHYAGTEMDIVGYNADGSRWTPAQRLAVANMAAAQGAGRFGLYTGNYGDKAGALHFGYGPPGSTTRAAWGPGGRTSGVDVSQFPKEEQAFAAWAKGSDPYSTYEGPGKFTPGQGAIAAAFPKGETIGLPVEAGGYAEALDNLAGGGVPGTGAVDSAGNVVRGFERDPAGNPVPPKNIPPPPAAIGAGAVTPQARTAMSQLVARGYTPEQAAGMVGNFMQESYPDLRTGVAGDKGTAFGIGQWRGERLAGLKAYAANNNLDINDLGTQVEYADYELQRGERGAGSLLRGANTVEEAVAAGLAYERPQGYSARNPATSHGYSNRLGYAQALLADYAGGAAPGARPVTGIPTPRTRESGLMAQPSRFDVGMGVTSEVPALGREGLAVPTPRSPPTFAETLDSIAAAADVPTPRLRPGDEVPLPRPRPVSGSQVSTPTPGPPQPAAPPLAGGAAAAGGFSPLFETTMEEAKRASTLTGGGETDQFAGGPTGGLPAPAAPVTPEAPTNVARGAPAPAPPVTAPPPAAPPPVGALTPEVRARLTRDLEALRARGGANPPTPSANPPTAVPANPPTPAGPAGANMTPSLETRAYPDPAALHARETELRTERAQREIFKQPPEAIFKSMSSLPPEQRVAARGDFVGSVMEAVKTKGPDVVAQIEASPQASRQLAAALGPDKARVFTTMLRAEAAGPDLARRFVAAAPAARVDRRVAEHVGRLLASDDPDDFARGVNLVAGNPALSGLLRQAA